MKRRWIGLALLALGIAVVAYADGASWRYAGRGTTIMPLKSTQVRMVSETVEIRPVTSEDRHKLPGDCTWVADCTFILTNESAHTATVLMGFPDTPYDAKIPLFRPGQPPQRFAIVDFRAWVDGADVETKAVPADPDMKKEWPDIARVFTWAVTFKSGETRIVRNRYCFGGISESREPGWSTYRVDYILRTGGLWKGPIGSAEIRIYPGREWNTGLRVECYPQSTHAAFWDFVAIAPAGYTIETKPERCIVWKFRDLVPQDDIQVIFATTVLEDLYPTVLWDDSSRESLIKVRDDFLAFHGKVFSDIALQAHYSSMAWDGKSLQVLGVAVPKGETEDLVDPEKSLIKEKLKYILDHWYVPSPSFQESDLGSCEKAFIAEIDARLAQSGPESPARPSR